MVPVAASHPPLDVRGLASADRAAAVLNAFDALRPSEAFELVASEDPRPYLKLLTEQRKGLFEWSPLAQDRRCWHVEVTRRNARLGALRRVTEALEWDHARLDSIERRAFEALAAGDRDAARRLFSAYHHGLNRHIRFEEEVLFPVFEMRTGLPYGGPTAVMRAEHREIRMLLEEIARDIADGPAAVEEPRRALLAILGDHHRREESILYPGTDELLTDAESDALVARIQAFPA